MGSLSNPLFFLGIFGVVGLVCALTLTTLQRMAAFFWFRPLVPRQVITNEQQDRKITSDQKCASTTPATGSVLSPGEEPTSAGLFMIPTQEFERLNATLKEICEILKVPQALVPEMMRLNHLLVESRTTGLLQNIEMLLQQRNDKLDGIGGKINDIYNIISQRERSTNMVPPEAEVARSNHYNGHSSEKEAQTGNRTPDNAHRTTRSKDNPISTEKEKSHRPTSPFEGKSYGSFVAEAEELVTKLNALVDQVACLFADPLRYLETSISGKESDDLLNEICYIEPWLCNKLHSTPKAENDHRLMITRLVLQSGLVNACGHIIERGFLPSDDTTLSHSDMVEIGQAVGGFEMNQKYLARIALKLITTVGGSLEIGGSLTLQHSDVLDDIVKTSLALHKTVNEAAISMIELVTYTIPCNTNFDQSQMEDSEEAGHITQDRVVCTLEMGLRCRMRKESSSEDDWDVVMKAIVVLLSTLEV